MAKERYFTGFEDGATYAYGVLGTPFVRGDGTARTGDFQLTQYAPGVGVISAINRPLATTYTCSTNGAMVRVRMQVAIRLRQHFSFEDQIFGFGDNVVGVPGPVVRCSATTTGLLKASIPNQVGTPVATTSKALQLNTLYVCRLEATWQRNDAGADPMFVSIQVYEADTMDDETPVLYTQAQGSGSGNIGTFSLDGLPHLGSGQPAARIVDFDDWWYAIGSDADASSPDLDWPLGSRVQAVPITAQGTQAQFTGNYLLCREIPHDPTTVVNEQTATGSGLQTTFRHKTAAELGLIPIGQLANSGDAEDQAAAPPFSGLPVPEGLSDAAQTYMAVPQDNTLPTPTISSIAPVAGAGSYNVGVFVRAFTIEWRSTGAGMSPVCGPLSASQYISAAQYPNFAANVVVSFGANTPADRFLDPSSPGTSAYRRYGLGLLVTNAYSNRAGSALMNPFPGSPNTTNLLTFDSRVVPNNPFGQLVALFGVGTPGGTTPPYDFTNPAQRPASVTFRLSQAIQSGGGGGVGEGFTTVSQWRYVFRAPSLVQDADKPVVAAFKVLVQAKRSAGSGTDNILLGGATHSIPISAAYGLADQWAIDWTERTADEFDALQFGFATTSGTATQLGNCLAEVLTAGPCTRKSAGRGQYQHQVGLIVPNGSYQTIPVDFTDAAGEPVAPSFVLVKHVRVGTSRTGAYKAWWMGGTLCGRAHGTLTNTPDSVAIMLLEPGGFLVGPSPYVNEAGSVYVYLAVYDGGQDTVNDAYFVTGSYERQSNLDPDVTVELGVPQLFQPSWTPDVVFIFGSSQVEFSEGMTAPSSDIFNVTGLSAQGVTAVANGTFTTGTAVAVSTQGQYCYFAYRFDPGGLLQQVFQDGFFAGTGGNLTIPTNFRAALLSLDHPQAGYDGRFKSDAGSSAALSTPWTGPPEVANNITAINDLSFDVGDLASVAGENSYWLAWKVNARIGNSGSSNLPPPGDPGDDDPGDDICAGGGMKMPPGTTGAHGCTAC